MDPSEVLAYLNHLGYRNISAQQLKEFIKDLKKLIKYDQKINSNLGKYKSYDITDPTGNVTQNQDVDGSTDIRDIFDFLYSRSTVSSQGKKVIPHRKQITVHITKKPHIKRHTHCMHIENAKSETQPRQVSPNYSSSPMHTDAQSSCTVRYQESSSAGPMPTEVQSSTTIGKQESSTTDDAKRPLSCQNVKSSTNTKSSKKSITRPESSKQINRCDPVALFQYYQSEWKRQKIPGKENHADLRCAVREKLLGGPPVDIRRTNKTSCRRVTICSDPALR